MWEYLWNEKNNTFTWLSSLYNPFNHHKTTRYPADVIYFFHPFLSKKNTDIARNRNVTWTILSCNSLPVFQDETVQGKTLWFGRNHWHYFFTNYQKSEYRPRGTLNEESMKVQWNLSETKDEIFKYLDQTFTK